MKQDELTIGRIKLLHPQVRDEATEMYNEICSRLTGKAMCRFTYTLRTFAEQDKLYALGRTVPNTKKVTNAKGGQSYHNYGLAFDICLLIDKDGDGKHEEASWDNTTDFDGDKVADFMEVVIVAKMYGWEWGGDWRTFPDKPHFQKTFGLTVMELKNRWDNKMLMPDNNYVKLS